jgi:hypothetical protein
MFSLLRKLFSREPPLRIHDPDFGQIRFHNDFGGYWTMENDWTVPFQAEGVSCVDIPGGREGPAQDAREFLLAKKSQPDQLWDLCEPFVRECMSGWDAFDGMEPRETFFITCINKDSDVLDGWEVCFESRAPAKWLYFCLQIKGEEVVTNTVST